MRLFNAEIFDETLEGDLAHAEAPYGWNLLLARAEALKFFCVADQVTGTPTLSVTLSGQNAGDSGEQTKIVINKALAAGTNLVTGAYSSQDPLFPPLRYLFVSVQITGANTKAHIRLWACGRGPQLLEAIPPASAQFSEQHAAAKMLADEDRLPLKKQVLRQGASLFYPPELFLPSLTWER